MKKTLATFLLLLTLVPVWAQDIVKETEDQLNLLMITNSGRNGYYDQKPIAETMGELAGKMDALAILSGGDTFHYLGVRSTEDPLWLSNFEAVYSHPELQLPWYAVFGNHEYKGDTEALLEYGQKSRRWMMPEHYYTIAFKEKDKPKVDVEVFFLDTPPLIDKYRRYAEKYPDASKQSMEAQLQWLDKALEKSTATWKICLGHHPIYAETSKADEERQDMQQRVLPILMKHKVDAYLSGHIHNFQHIRKPACDIDFAVISSGAKSRKVKPTHGTIYCSDKSGFAAISASEKELKIYFLDKDGNILHRITRVKK